MFNPSYENCRKRAIETLNGPRIDYNNSDCQDAVEQIIQDCGGQMEFKGSNAMWRYAIIASLPKAKAMKLGLKGGELTFRHADGYNSNYNDEMGDADHVGMFIGAKAYYDNGWSNGKGGWCDVFHSSQSRDQVCGSNLSKNDWTDVALAACVQYSDATYAAFGVRTATVVSENGKPVNLRKTKESSGSSNRIAGVPSGSSVLAGETDGEWTRVAYGGYAGWMQSKFVSGSTDTSQGLEGIIMAGSALYDAKVVTSGGILNIRSAPRTGGTDIGDIPNGDLLQVLEETNSEWARVFWNGMEGYVKREFISRITGASLDDDSDEVVGTSGGAYGLYIPCASLEAARALQSILRSGVVKHMEGGV